VLRNAVPAVVVAAVVAAEACLFVLYAMGYGHSV
jgi:hypothetical protein